MSLAHLYSEVWIYVQTGTRRKGHRGAGKARPYRIIGLAASCWTLPTELFFPKLFDKTSEVAWAKAGSKDIGVVARERAKKILREHSPEPLSEDVGQRPAQIVKEAEGALVKGA
jgi:trimethylamine:corrinoid methyltransferase-like protein